MEQCIKRLLCIENKVYDIKVCAQEVKVMDAFDFSALRECLTQNCVGTTDSHHYIDYLSKQLKDKIHREHRSSADRNTFLSLPDEILCEISKNLPKASDKLSLSCVSTRLLDFFDKPSAWPLVDITLDIRDQRESQWRFLKKRVDIGIEELIITFPNSRCNREERVSFENKVVANIANHKNRLKIMNKRSRHLEPTAPLMIYLVSERCSCLSISVTNVRILPAENPQAISRYEQRPMVITDADIEPLSGSTSCNLVSGRIRMMKAILWKPELVEMSRLFPSLCFETMKDLELRSVDGLRRVPNEFLRSLDELKLYDTNDDYYPSYGLRLDDYFDFRTLARVPRLRLHAEMRPEIFDLQNLIELRCRLPRTESLVADFSSANWPIMERLQISRPRGDAEWPELVDMNECKIPVLTSLRFQQCLPESLNNLRSVTELDVYAVLGKPLWRTFLSNDFKECLPGLLSISLVMPNFNCPTVTQSMYWIKHHVFPEARVSVYHMYCLIGRRDSVNHLS